jgi:5-oxoprolinase (ATP-hydrolysing) subunit C
MSFRVLDPGLATRLVDLGRPRTRHLGVSVGGAADRACFTLANALVGNVSEYAALEISLKGPILRAEADVTVAIVGAPFVGAGVVGTSGCRRLLAGDELYLGGATAGVRAYIAVPGGFDAPVILDSRSGLEPVRAGDRLICASTANPLIGLGTECPFLDFPHERTLAVLPGPQRDWFSCGELGSWTVSTASDRMGIRLDGPNLPALMREMVSEPVCPGSVQITREGQPIVLGVDGQTIGGYPKIAQVIRADLDALGQLRAGTLVRFEWVDAKEARRRWQARAASLREWTTRIALAREA